MDFLEILFWDHFPYRQPGEHLLNFPVPIAPVMASGPLLVGER